MKKCFKCHIEKPLEQFYKHAGMADGHLGKCKDCAKADVAANYRSRHDQYLQYEKHPVRVRRRRKRAAGNQARYRSRYPDRYRAHYALNNAVRDGRLKRMPCEVCGVEKVQAHHTDYSKPLEVRWLCQKHHRLVEGRCI